MSEWVEAAAATGEVPKSAEKVRPAYKLLSG